MVVLGGAGPPLLLVTLEVLFAARPSALFDVEVTV
jgi:hypothetical protein